MLHTISWQQYVTAVALLSIAWYAYVLLRYYRTDLGSIFFNQKTSMPLVASGSVMGAIKTDQTVHDPEELRFGSAQTDDLIDHSLPPGATDQLLAETQTLVQAFVNSPNKAEFLSLLGVLISKYEPFEDEIDLKVIWPLAAQLPFPITEQEWPTL